MRRFIAVAILATLAPVCGAASARAEIQTLFRGECYTPEEGAAKLSEFAKTYDTPTEWKERAAKIRSGILKGLKLENLPPAAPFTTNAGGTVIRRNVWAGDGYSVANVAFESLPGYWVTGNLYLPTEIDGELAGVLCPHGHSPDGRLAAYTQVRCAALARMGAAVFAWDMVGYGESQPVPHGHSQTQRLQTYNSIRCIDFLLSLRNVNRQWQQSTKVDERRLGVTGESGGGTQTFLLAAVDDRIDVSAPCVMVSAHFFGGCTCESGLPIHKHGDFETNNAEIAACIAPKPLLLISDGQDWTSQVPKVEFPYIRRIYDMFLVPDNVRNEHFADEGHDYGRSKRKAMYPFMAEHLDLDLSKIQDERGEITEDFFVERTREELLAFPPDMPRPKHVVTDAEAVIKLLDKR